MKSTVRYFPFSSGIPWKYNENDVIIPEINAEIFQKSIQNKKIIVLAHGNLFESWFSLSFFETMNITDPFREVYWAGNEEFKDLLKINNLAKPIDVPKDLKIKFPVPIFFDKEDCVYFNCFNNYLNKVSLNEAIITKNTDLVFKQIFDNFLIRWDTSYIPKIRKQEQSKEFITWIQTNKFSLEKPFIVIFKDKVINSCLNWDEDDIKNFATLLKKQNILTIVITSDNKKMYYDGFVYKAPKTLEFIYQLVPKAASVLSKDIEFLLLSLMISNAKIITNTINEEIFDLEKNKNYLGASNDIYIKNELTVAEAVEFVRK